MSNRSLSIVANLTVYSICFSVINTHAHILSPSDTLLANHWRAAGGPGQVVPARAIYVSPNLVTFNAYYNGVQDSMKALAGMDELLEGICSNEKCTLLVYVPNYYSNRNFEQKPRTGPPAYSYYTHAV